MSQVITDAFSNYWQQCLVDQTPVVLDEFVLAHIPGLDPDAPIDPASGLPPADQIVHRHAVDQRGRINNDAVAYSIVMDTTVGDFTFNAMYLINTGLNLVGMIVHKGEETKLATDPGGGQTGNSLVKSMLMEYDRAAEASQTVIDASTWQIDYAARLRGMDEDLRRQAMGTFGHAAFYGDGFKLVNDAGLYKVQPGQGYVGGLLVELASEQEVAPSAKPVGLWLDVYRAGSLLSPWVNQVTLTLSTTELVDYVDANGYPHFVTRLATINADDSVTDTRARRTLTLTGDVTGQASFNGPDSIELEVTIKDNSHAHTIENVTGLQEAMDGKSPTGHTHTPDEAGAAPAGYGLGEVTGRTLSDKSCNEAVEAGWYSVYSGTTDTPQGQGPSGARMMVTTWNSGSHVSQLFFGYESNHIWVRSSQYDDETQIMTWKPWTAIYTHEAPPTAADVGALAKVGDTATGNLTAPKFIMNAAQGTGDGDAVRYDYLANQLPNRAGLIGASKDLNTYQTPGFYVQPATADATSGSNYPVDLAGTLLVLKSAGISQIYITYSTDGNRRIYYRNFYSSAWSAWTAIYDTNFKPTAADVGAAPLSHTHTAAQGNQDIVAGSYGQVGTYALLHCDAGATSIGATQSGSSLHPADAEGYSSGAMSGTWKQLGYRSVKASDNTGSETTLFIRIA